MTRPVLWVLTCIALSLGLAHVALGALASGDWSMDALWFVGSGLAILMAGLINVIMLRAKAATRDQKAVWGLVNLLAAGFFGLAWLVVKEPQVIVGGFVFLLLCLAPAAPGPSGPPVRSAP